MLYHRVIPILLSCVSLLSCKEMIKTDCGISRKSYLEPTDQYSISTEDVKIKTSEFEYWVNPSHSYGSWQMSISVKGHLDTMELEPSYNATIYRGIGEFRDYVVTSHYKILDDMHGYTISFPGSSIYLYRETPIKWIKLKLKDGNSFNIHLNKNQQKELMGYFDCILSEYVKSIEN